LERILCIAVVSFNPGAVALYRLYRIDRTLRWTKILLSGVVTGIAIAYVSSQKRRYQPR
jgi:hypothetical protein